MAWLHISEPAQALIRKYGVPTAAVAVLVGIVLITIFVSPKNTQAPDATTPSPLQPFAVNKSVPLSYVTDKTGESVLTDSTFTSQALITFWSVNCTNCQQALTEQQQFSAAHPNFPLILINSGDTPDAAANQLLAWQVTLPDYYDTTGDTLTKWSGTMPSSFFVKNKQILYYFPGRITTDLLNVLVAQ